jgi:hypothetical protein
MITATLLFTLMCPQPIMVNESKEAWNKHDKLSLKQAQKRCSDKYKRSPCVKLFIKREPRTHAVLCGST